ncbi:MAG: hypothetical protein H0T89_18170 [Deltaproteobacteria bacterium]|nr:hypothetical protein [Deltaproteobacteria bacterium]MDQ3299206.1 hypothetical protein [Myxococcota bacterium]
MAMRIGEILLSHGWVDEQHLLQAIAEQRMTGKRLCSLLIVRGQLQPDFAARALAEQHGVAAALQRHLDHRERPLARLIPAAVAREHGVLPIGRMRDGEIILCLRDPRSALVEHYEALLQKNVVLAVASAHSLDPLIEIAYAPGTTGLFEVRIKGGTTPPPTVPVNPPPAPPPPSTFAAGTERPRPVAAPARSQPIGDGAISNGAAESIDIDLESGPIGVASTVPPPSAPLPEASGEMPEIFTIVDLDDSRVDKDPSQVGKNAVALPPSTAPPRSPTLPPPNVTRSPGAKKP